MKGHSQPVSEVYKYNFVNVRYANGMSRKERRASLSRRGLGVVVAGVGVGQKGVLGLAVKLERECQE